MTQAFIQGPAAERPSSLLLLPFWIPCGVDSAAALLSAAKDKSEAHIKAHGMRKPAIIRPTPRGTTARGSSRKAPSPANKTQVQGTDVGADRELPEGPKPKQRSQAREHSTWREEAGGLSCLLRWRHESL